MKQKDKLFGDFLSPCFNQIMGNSAYPITKVFHYLMGFPTGHFSRRTKISIYKDLWM